MNAVRIDTPLGAMRLVEEGGALVRVDLPGEWDKGESAGGENAAGGTPLLAQVRQELDEYFRGERQVFDVPLAPQGTSFQREVWQALGKIPYGETRSYSDVAKAVGRPKAVRAVGGANHANPIAIIIPCHRVIGANGSLTGYGGGLEAKALLLQLEQAKIEDAG